MGTRSRIGIFENDQVTSIYCHYDGYLSHNGAILQEHYNDRARVKELIRLGDISTLGKDIGKQCGFNSASIAAQSFTEFLEQCEGCDAEYYYIMKDDVWYAGCVYDTVGLRKNALALLTNALKELIDAEVA